MRPILRWYFPSAIGHEYSSPNPTKPEQPMSQGEIDPAALEGLGSEARSVLAVLVLAALWPARFPGGWVSVGAFGRCGIYLGERTDRESLKAAIRRGLRRVEASHGVGAVERRRTTTRDPLTGQLGRDLDRRLREQPSSALEAWLDQCGSPYLDPILWRAYHREHPLGGVGPRPDLRVLIARAETCLRLAQRQAPAGSWELRRISRLQELVAATRARLDGDLS